MKSKKTAAVRPRIPKLCSVEDTSSRRRLANLLANLVIARHRAGIKPSKREH